MMSNLTTAVEDALRHLGDMLASSGGKLYVIALDPDEPTLTVGYKPGVDEACSRCVLSAEDLGAFIREALDARGAGMRAVTVIEEP